MKTEFFGADILNSRLVNLKSRPFRSVLRNLSNADFLISFGLFSLYFFTLPYWLPEADGPQFVVIGLRGGIAHPPGYPLYCYLLRAISLFYTNPESAFHAFLIFSCFTTALSAWVLLDMLRRLEFSVLSRGFAVSIGFTGVAIWNNANNTEPFALNLLLCTAIMWCICAHRTPDRFAQLAPNTVSGLLGLLFGWGFCNHHTQAILLPATFISILIPWQGLQDARRQFVRFTCGFICGLLPIIYFFTTDLAAPMVWAVEGWQHNPWNQLLRHLFRMDYGTFKLVATDKSIFSGLIFTRFFVDDLFYVGAALGLVGFAVSAKSLVNSNNRNLKALAPLLVNLPAIGAFVLMARISVSSLSEMILLRFAALPIICFIPFVAVGVETLNTRLRTNFLSILAVTFTVGHVLYNSDVVDKKNQPLAEFYLRHVLQISSGGQLVGISDISWAGIPFMREVYGLGSDVMTIFYQHLVFPSYFQGIVEKSGLKSAPPKDTSALLLALAAKGRLFTENYLGNEPVNELLYPVGPVLRAADSPARKPYAVNIFAVNSRIYRELLKVPALAQAIPTTPVELGILRRYALVWAELEETFKPYDKRLADKCRAYHNIILKSNDTSSDIIDELEEKNQKKTTRQFNEGGHETENELMNTSSKAP